MLKKKFSILFVILILLTNMFTTTFATEKELVVPISDAIENAVFLITWENDVNVDISLVKPDNNILTSKDLNDSYVKEKNKAMIFLNNPDQGDWKVIVSGEEMGKVSVSLNEMEELFEISKFDVDKVNDSTFDFKWSTKNVGEGSISISLYVDDDNQGYDGMEIGSFTGKVQDSREINISKLDWGNYYFYIKVQDSLGIDDYLYSDETFEITNPNTQEEISSVKVSVIDDSVKIQWEKSTDPTIKKYRIMIFEDGNNKPFLIEETDESEFISPSLEQDKVQVAVAALNRDNLLGKYKKLSVDLGKSKNIMAEVELPEKDIINTKVLTIPLKMEKGYKVSIYINEEIAKENIIEGGILTLELKDGTNDLVIVVEDNEGNARTFAKKLLLDTYPPQLSVSRDYQSVSTGNKSIVLSGEVEPNSKLYLNDKEIEVQENGVFVHSMTLSFGKNNIVLKAMDIAGNTSYYYGSVNRFVGTGFLYTIILLLSSVATIVFMVFIYKSKKKHRGTGENDNV